MRGWRARFAKVFGLDLRALAALRVGLALVLLADLSIRAQSLVAHYSGRGVLPRDEVRAGAWRLSLYFISDDPGVHACLVAVAALAGVALLVGYQSRLASFVSWVLLISLHTRNPLVLTGGDTYLRVVLFWSMFLPLGARFSVDSALSAEPARTSNQLVSAATFALVGQVCTLYLFSAVLKHHPVWYEEFSAVYYALQTDAYTTQLGNWLREQTAVLPVLTVATLSWEIAGPLLAMAPVASGPLRTLAVAGFVTMHVGFALTLNLGIFPFVGAVAWIGLLPAWFWDRLEARWRRPARTGLRIYYDRECGVCRKLAHLVRTFALLPDVEVAPAQDHPSVAADLERHNSWVVAGADGDRRFEFDALVFLFRRSPWLWPWGLLLGLSPFRWIGTRAYRWAARRRLVAFWFVTRLRPAAIPYRLSTMASIFVGFMFVYVMAWNVRTLDYKRFSPLFPKWLNGPAELFRVDQRWNMFAPTPARQDGWFIAIGELADGRQVDVLREGAPVSFEKPELVNDLYPTYRWRKYMTNLWKSEFRRHRSLFAAYVCRSWNADHSNGQRLRRFELIYMREDTLPDRIAEPRQVSLSTYRCTPRGVRRESEGRLRPAG